MAYELHTLDPDGDLLLILGRPDQNQNAEELDQNTNETENNEGVPDENSANEVHFLVSSKHLTLASPVFKAMLRPGGFIEGRQLAQNGSVEVQLDDDPAALKILLQVVHNRFKDVPKEVNLDMLTKFSTLVDKYQMLDAADVYANMWIEALSKTMPAEYSKGVMPWLSIAWVFKRPAEFKKMSYLLAHETGDSITSLSKDLPLSQLVIDGLVNTQIEAIRRLLDILNDIIDKFMTAASNNEFLCHNFHREYDMLQCDSMALGSLIRGAVKRELYPAPSPPFDGLSVKEVTHNLKAIFEQDYQDWCKNQQYSRSRSHVDANELKGNVIELWNLRGGLDISDYMGPKTLK